MVDMYECVRIHLCIDPVECHQPDSNLRLYEGRNLFVQYPGSPRVE